MLRSAGCESLLEAPPPAALEAVDLCGCLPLTLALAGGAIKEMPDTWQRELVPLLQEEFEFVSETRSRGLCVLHCHSLCALL